MRITKIEIADIFRKYGNAYKQNNSLPLNQLRAMHAIEICRTSQLGGHVDKCDECESKRISYNSCRNRHCPKCQFMKKEKWLLARMQTILPIQYFHVVSTIPSELNSIALRNQKIIYDILFRSNKEMLLELAGDPKLLGASIGFISILHTWGQNLMDHPHIHSVVPGGGLSLDGKKWINSRKDFFLPVEVMSKLFKGKFLHYLKESYNSKELKFPGNINNMEDPEQFRKLLKELYKKDWVVFCKPPFKNPETIIEYLARYTHRVALSNNRITDMQENKISFSWKDYADGDKKKIMTLDAEEFIRRFLLHILPAKFVKIRYYGFMGNSNQKTTFALCCKLLKVAIKKIKENNKKLWQELLRELTGIDILQCPFCKKGRMHTIETLLPERCHSP